MPAPANLSRFQQQFAHYLRDPNHHKRPRGVSPRAGRRYADLVFANVFATLTRCFPVACKVLGESRWLRLCRVFFRDSRIVTPFFSQLPKALVDYVASPRCRQRLPLWMAELLHYEWIELAIEIMPEAANTTPAGFRKGTLRTNPTLQILHYHWPLQKISNNYRPKRRQDYYCLAFRDSDHCVRFIEVNQLSAFVVQQLSEQPQAITPLLSTIAQQLNVADSEQFINYGRAMLTQLTNQQVLLEE